MKPNHSRAKYAIVFIALIFILDLFSLLFDYLEYLLLTSDFNQDIVTEAENNDLRQSILGILYILVYITSVVFFIRWFRRAYYNLHTKIDHLSHSEGWAAGSWFIPFICLYRPYQIMKEMYTETVDYLEDQNKKIGNQYYSYFIGFWWTLWIISNFLGRIYFKETMNADTISELLESNKLSIINTAISIPLALVTIKVIYDYSNLEKVLFNIKNDNPKIELTTVEEN
ncbi:MULTISPECIES: DUF4328 domain-containing protein [Flavobacterium]|uniref:DUF4328 domain-containing protein n=1 Tax=Flavobacterium hankyongi TaxID=1176532 RepID=A0ABP8ZIK5_9FLAO|nr:DUF4328 domain-containing protein [Flavobacterium sp. N1846]